MRKKVFGVFTWRRYCHNRRIKFGGLNNMKNIMSITLIFAMLFLMIPIVGIAAEAADYENAIATVEALGFMNGYPDGTFRSEINVTRAEFASVISKILNFSPDLSKGEATPFYDVPASHWASPYVNIVNNQGLMNGYGNGLFVPENNITVGEAAKVMVVLMGYGYFAEAGGGFPTGYYVQANTLDLLDGINTDGNALITRGELAQMLCSAFEVDIYSPDSYGVDVGIRKEDGVTILSKYHDIYDVEGIVTANEFTSVNGDSATREGEIEIDGERYYTEFDDAASYLGYNVKIYYREDDSGKRTVLYMEPCENNTLQISSDDFGGASGYKLTYYEDSGKKRTIDIESNTNIILNNEFVNRAVNFNLDSLSAINGTITFISNDGNDKYDVILIKDYTVGVVESVNISGERISFKFGVNGFSLEETSYVIYKGEDEIALSEINANAVLSIAASRRFLAGETDGVVEMIVSDKTVSGTVDAVSDGKIFISTKEGTAEYKISSKYVSETGALPNISDNGIFYLDSNDKVIWCQKSSRNGLQFGYLIDARLDEGLMTTVYLKILTSSGEVKIITAKDRLRMDGTSVTSKEMYNALRNISDTPQISMIIRYLLNDDELLSAIDTKEPNSDNDPDALTLINEDTRMRFQDPAKMLVCNTPKRYIIDDNVMVFEIPGESNDDDEYKVYGNSYFKAFEYYGGSSGGETMTFCNVKDGSPAAIFMMGGSASASTQLGRISMSENPTGVIKNKVYTLDEDGMEGIKLVLACRDSDVELFVTKDTKLLFANGTGVVSSTLPGSQSNITLDDFRFGDIIMYDAGSKNKANVLLRINDTDVSTLKEGEYQVTGMSGYTEFIMGSVRSKNGTKLELDVSTDPDLYINSRGICYVYLVEMANRNITKVTFDEILASQSDLDADKVFVRIRFGAVKEIYIYR